MYITNLEGTMGFKLKPEATYPIQITHAYWFQILKRKEKRQKLSSMTNHLSCAPSFPLPALNKLLYTQHSFWLWYAPYPPSNIFLIRCLQALNLPNANTTEQKREERKRLYERRKKNQQMIKHRKCETSIPSLFNHFLLAGSHFLYCSCLFRAQSKI